jgi:hypothetical protein
LTQPRNRCDDFKITVAVKQQDIVFNRELRDATVDRASNGFTPSPKIEKDARGIGPGSGTAFEILLSVQVFAQKVPFNFVQRALQKFELVEPRKDRLFAIKRRFKGGASPAGPIAQNVDPDGRVDQNHRSFRIDLWSKSLRKRILPASSMSGFFFRDLTSS